MQSWVLDLSQKTLDVPAICYQDHCYQVKVFGEVYEQKKWYERLKEKYPLRCCAEDILFYAYQEYGTDCMRQIRGAYSWLLKDETQTMVLTPPFNLYPLYYTRKANQVFLSPSYRALAKARGEKLIVNSKGLLELFSFSPCTSSHQSVYRSMHALPAGHVLRYADNHLKAEKWYVIPTYQHTDDFETSVKTVRALLKASIDAQKEGVEASLLSGGLDSSVIVSQCAENGLRTYSLDYEGNANHFKANRFQTGLDAPFIEEMVQRFDLSHTNLTITQQALADCIEPALYAREVPGMGDIDASLYWLVGQLKDKEKLIFSGECSDEVFGGYPWFYRKEYDSCDSFPFLAYQKDRLMLLSDTLKRYPFDAYIQNKYEEVLKDIVYLDNDSELDKRFRRMTHLTMDYFMQTLVVRQVTMSNVHGVTIRAPFADTALLEYVYNLPAAFRCHQGVEKHVLREAFRHDLPDSIFQRKKNPFPKTHNPQFADIMQKKLRNVLKAGTPLLQLFDQKALEELIDTKGASFQFPWFGQLMSGPQLLSYIYSLHLWLSQEDVQLDLC